MAKKQTLKSLLGVSDNRVQVEYKGVTEAVTPAVIPSAGTTPYVQDTPKTNALLEVVDAMNKAPKLYATQIGIAQTEAAEAISKLTDFEIAQELAENDDATMSIFGYNKAYNEGLVKRHYKVNAKAYETELNTLASNLSEYPDEADFNAALEAKVEEIKQNNAAQFGRNRFQAGANDEAFQEVIGEYVANASGNYLANKQEMVVTDFSATFRDSMDDDIKNELFTADTATTHIKQLHEDLKNVPMKNSEKGRLMAEQIQGYANLLIEAGDLEEAEALIKAGYAYDVTGKKGSLGAAQSSTFTALTKALNNAKDQESSVNVNELVQEVSGQLRTQSFYLLDESSSDAEDVRYLLNSFRSNVDADKIEELVTGIMDVPAGEGRVQALNSALEQLGKNSFLNKDGQMVNPSNLHSKVYKRLTGVFADTFTTKAQLDRQRLYGIKGQELTDLEADAQVEFDKDSRLTVTGFMKQQGLSGVTVPESIRKIYDDVHVIDFISNPDTVLGKRYNGIFTSTDYANSSLARSINRRVDEALPASAKAAIKNNNTLAVENYLPDLQIEARDYARTLTGTLEEKEKLMGEWLDEKLNSFTEARQAINSAPTVLAKAIEALDDREIYDDPPNVDVASFTDDEPTVGDTRMQNQIGQARRSYPHLTNPNRNIVANDELYATVRNDLPALKATQILYGYSEYSPSSAKDLVKTGYTLNEVSLFGSLEELETVTGRWREALNAYNTDPDGLTDDQIKTIEEAGSFGINLSNFTAFFEIQGDLLN